VSLASHNIAWFNIAAWLPLLLLFKEATAYSIVYLNILALNGISGFLFMFELMRRRLPAVTCGLIIAFWPLILSHHHHPNIIILAWVLLSALFLKRTVEQKKPRDALVLAVFLALIGISRWQMLLLGGVFIAGYFIYLAFQPGNLSRRSVLLVGIAGVLSVVIMLPFLWPGLKELFSISFDSNVFNVGEGNSLDFLALFIPSRYHPLWGPKLVYFYESRFINESLFVPFIGYTTLLLLTVGLVKQWRKARIWFILAIILLLLAMGDEFKVGGVSYFSLPYSFLKEFELIRLIRHPLRFGIVLVIPVAVLAGYGMHTIRSLPRLSSGQINILSGIVIAFLLFEFVVDFPMMSLQVPKWFDILALDEEEFGIVDIPLGGRSNNEDYMFYQITHLKPLVGGKIARVPSSSYKFISDIPMLEQSFNNSLPSQIGFTVSYQFSKLRDNNVRYLVLHKNKMAESTLTAWVDFFDLPPYYEDDELIVYDTDLPEPKAIQVLDTGVGEIGIINHQIETLDINQSIPLSILIHWYRPGRLDDEIAACFFAVDAHDNRHLLDCYLVASGMAVEEVPEDAVMEDEYKVSMDPHLVSGKYSIELAFQAIGHDRLHGDTLTLGRVNFSTLPRQIANVIEENTVAIWDDKIALSDFSLRNRGESELNIDLRFQALTEMTESYKVFLHLIDVGSGEIVMQRDFIPRKWTYPTAWWKQYEVVGDTIKMNLDEVGEGDYQLWLGFYSEDTSTRLPISFAEGMEMNESGDALLLDEFEQ
jgi:hypothetical protein